MVRRALSGDAVAPEELFGRGGFSLTLTSDVAPPPIWLAALGERMLRVAGEVADGVLLNWCTPERVAHARRVVDEAASDSGRDPSSVTVAVYVRACLGVDGSAALEALRQMTGLYASFPPYRRQMEAMGLGDLAVEAAAAIRAGRPEAVPDELVRALAVTGGRSEALERFDRYRSAGADLVLSYPVAARDPFSSVLGTILAAAPSPAIER